MIAGILLAAGESKRFRPENKLLYEIKGASILEHLLRRFLKSDIDTITIVVGYQKSKIINLVQSVLGPSDIPVNFSVNKDYKKGGMSSSIIKGIQTVINSEAVLITPGDIPFIPTNAINEVISHYRNNMSRIIIPTFENRKGHPILISSELYNEVLLISEELRGLKEITKRNENQIVFLPTKDKGIIRDIDTKEDLLLLK